MLIFEYLPFLFIIFYHFLLESNWKHNNTDPKGILSFRIFFLKTAKNKLEKSFLISSDKMFILLALL